MSLGNAEDGGQHPRWKPAEGLTDADVVFVFRRTGVLDDHDRQVGGAAVHTFSLAIGATSREIGCRPGDRGRDRGGCQTTPSRM